ncbi:MULTISPECIES: ABC transporter substrate-binding protein [Halorussus]|uniref:ABC transporter substrate-binding protein n=1 Tax=Halorussus TaxID=1070314 RepID=UPI000E210EDB|nr:MULTISPECIES: ABC transporter substrate-binding protein [Halorussus]NHN60653.1 ABC transporter substrate-binding protein [Halorussus sp. JP-T4]
MDGAPTSRLTRRRLLRGAGAAGGAALVAGCTGGRSGDADTTTGTDSTTAERTSTEKSATTADGTGPYSVTMSPMGEVEFEGVPENVFTVFPQYADMAVALGHGDAVNATYVPEMSGTTMNHYYHHLDGVSFDWEGLADPLTDGLPKELLFELDSDVHLADPAWASTQDNWTKTDVEEIESQIAPWFGNFYSGTQAPAPEGYDDYRYYDLWELFGKVAAVFRETERYEALARIHSDLVSTIQEKLPPKEERPTAVRVTLAGDGESFWTYHLNKPGYWLADTRPLGANDAFAEEDWGSLWGQVDYETMLQADPDVVLHLWGMTPNYSMSDTLASLQDHPVGSQLTAVENDRVYPAGMRYQGPIMNLFQIEMGAKQLYPDLFGEWPDYEDGQHYPEVPEDEQLFDRTEVAEIIASGG